MALVPRRIVLVAIAVASIAAGLVVPATAAFANSVPAPTLVSPANTTGTPLKDVVLQWNPVPGATLYQVQISPNDEWTNNTVTLPTNGQTVNDLFEVPISLPHASYFWHVRAQVGGVWGSYSVAWQFLRDWATSIDILRAPTSEDPTISWSPISDASLYVVTFVDEDKTSAELSCYTEQTSFTPYVTVPSPTVDGLTPQPEPIPEDLPQGCFGEGKLVAGDTYGWGIEAYDDTTAPSVVTDDFSGDPLACSTQLPECGGYAGDTYVSPTPFVFQAPTPTGGAFNPLTTATGLQTTWHPASSASGTACSTTALCPVTPTFSWDPTPGANQYRVDVYLDPEHTNDFRTYTTAWPELTPRDFYFDAQAGAWYYWTVQPEYCQSGCTAPATTTTCAAGAAGTGAAGIASVTNPTPADGENDMPAGSTATITLSESSSEIPTCVSASDGNVIKIDSKGAGSIQFDYQAPAAAGSVNFLILNSDGTTSAEAGPLTITTSNNIIEGQTSAISTFGKRSGPVTLTSPVNGATLHGGSVTFKWADFLATGGDTALEARNYEVQVSQDPSFDTTAIDDADVDLTQYSNPTNFLNNGSYYWRVVAIDESGHQLTWSPTYHFTVDATSPSVSFLTGDGIGVGKSLSIQTSERLSNIKTSTLKVVPQGDPASDAVPGKILKGATSKLYTFVPNKALGTGVTYVLVPSPSLVDSNGNPVLVDGSGVTTALIAKSTSPGWTYSHGWFKQPASSALSGYVYSAGAGRQASLIVGGAEAHLFGCLGPNFGTITVSVAGHNQSISEHQKGFTTCGVEIWHRALPATSRKLTISVVSGVGDIDEVQVDPIGGTTTTTTGGSTTG